MATNQNNLNERPPIIAIMGHIDHGKSTLLDYIRQSNIVAGEAGGITQHISAYEVVHKDQNGQDKKITFLDTPGHEAFQAMRERGASIADIAVLIVSAEEGVKAQTLEALRAITEAKIPYIVAINKIDRPNANIERTKQILSENNILIEEWGGKVPCVPISAKTGDGVDNLLTMMLLVAEMEELTGNHQAPATGFVLETKMDQRSGVTATLVIKDGTLTVGDFICADGTMAKVKKIDDFLGRPLKEATFSSPIRVFGFSEIPKIGACFQTFSNKKAAEDYASECQRLANTCKQKLATADNDQQISIPIVVKADVAGSLEAVEKEILKNNTDAINIKIVQTGVGTVSENDVKLAGGSTDALIIGFHVGVDRAAIDLAERLNIPIQTFDIIYKMSEWLAEIVEKRTPKVETDNVLGRAKILKTFSRVKDKQVVGGGVLEGKAVRGREVKIIRKEVEIGRGRLTDLEMKKLKTGEVEAPEQFGAVIDSKHLLAAGDILEIIERTHQ